MSSTRDPKPFVGTKTLVGNKPSAGVPGLRRAVVSTLAVAALIPSLTGCKNLSYQRPVEPAMNPTGDDEAMARRQWGETQALYANSGVKVYATRFRYNYATASQQSPYSGIILGPLAFVAQSLAFPLTFLRAKPFATEVQHPLAVEPSFTVNPARLPQGTVAEDAAGLQGVVGAGGGPTNPAGIPIQPSAPGVTPGGSPGGIPANPVPGTPRQGGAEITPGSPSTPTPGNSVVPELTPPGTPGGTPAPGTANPSNPAPGGGRPGSGGGPVGPGAGGAGGAGGGGAGGR